MRDDAPRPARQLVLVGGGHAHVAVLKAFGMQRMPEVRLVLISDHWDTPYSGMLPAMIAGHYSRDDIHVDLHRLCRFAGGEFCRDRVVGLDLKNRQVLLRERPPVHFDLLSINTGSLPAADGVPGAREFAIPVKPIDELLRRLVELERRFRAHPDAGLHVITVGGGAGGVELTLSLQHRLQAVAKEPGVNARGLRFTLVTRSADLLDGHNRGVRRRFARLLADRGVQVHTGKAVTEVTGTQIGCADGTRMDFDAVFWATHAAAPEWPRAAGLAVNDQGFIQVNSFLRSTSHDFVYAAGDVAAMSHAPRPKSGVYAVRQGPPLALNLRHGLMGFHPRRYRPQRTFLSLISTGDRQAVASKGPFAAGGRALWHWKQRIDQRWMRRYRDLPVMSDTEPEMDFTARMKRNLRTTDHPDKSARPDMRCGGCGAKVGSLILREALKQLRVTPQPSVIIGLNAPDDAAVLSPPPGRLLVQSVDFFRTLLNDPWLFGRIAASHALNDLYAMGATPLAAQATVTLELANERIMTERLTHLLAGAVHELNAAGATLVGGHSAEGRETALGLAVTGTVPPGQLFRKTGLRPGDQLILTKPLGTGVLFAADMALALSAPWLAGALASMLQSNGPAVDVFARHGVTTCTDVSGFGLLGHMREMLGATEVKIAMSSSALPSLPGVKELLQAHWESSLAPANAHFLNLVDGIAVTEPVATRLLLDPQTGGPLLAAVPAQAASDVLPALAAAGFGHAAIIGEVLPANGGKPVCLLK